MRFTNDQIRRESMRQPQKYVGPFVVTTRRGRTVSCPLSIEAAEDVANLSNNYRGRVIWRWFEGRYVAK